MAKLYAELTSDKTTRVVSKGGDEMIAINLNTGNTNAFYIVFEGDQLRILRYSDGTTHTLHWYDNQQLT